MNTEDTHPSGENSFDISESEYGKFLDEESRILLQNLNYKQLQRKEEIEDKKKVDERLDQLYKTLRDALKTRDLDWETQRELGILLRLVPKIRERNDLDIVAHLEIAINALLKESVPETKAVADSSQGDMPAHRSSQNGATEGTSSVLGNAGDRQSNWPNPNRSKLRSMVYSWFFIHENRPANFVYANRIRKNIQYQVSPQSSKSTYLILGLGIFVALAGALPMFFFIKSQPPVLKVTPTSLNEIEITGDVNQVNVQPNRERLNTQVSNNLITFSDAKYTIRLLDSEAFQAVISANATDIGDAVATRIESDLTSSLRQTVRRNMAEALAVQYEVETSPSPTVLVQAIAENIVQQANQQIENEGDRLTSEEVSEWITDSLAAAKSTQEDDEISEVDSWLNDRSEAIAELQLIDRTAVSNSVENAVADALAVFPFDELTTPQTQSIRGNSSNNTGNSANPSAGTGTADSGPGSGAENSLNGEFEELGIDWRFLLVVVAGGAFGGTTFIILKAQNANTYVNEDRFSLFFAGLLKPLSGVALALFLFAALESDALPVSLKTSEVNSSQRTYLIFAVSFIAGFSQLLVQDTISKAQSSVIGTASRGPDGSSSSTGN